MQITIAQDEIEAAIKNYIQEQITVKEDQDIDIDLRATRGEAGFQATINITKAGAAKPVREPEAPVAAVTKTVETTQAVKPVATTTRVKPVVTKVTPAKPAPVVEAEPEIQDEQPVVQEEEDTQSGVGQAEEAGSDQTDTVEVNEDETETQQEEAPAPAARPSLFGGLKKPVNV